MEKNGNSELKIDEVIEKTTNALQEALSIYGVHDLIVSILEDNFIIKEKDDYFSDSFYCSVDRSNYEILEIKMKRRESLKNINTCAKIIVDVLKCFEKEYNILFGIKITTIDELKENMEFLLSSGINKDYRLGKHTSSNSFYGLTFNPSCYFDITFTDEDRKRYSRSKLQFYCEYDIHCIDVKKMASFLCDIVETNRKTIEKYMEESKEESND